MRPRALTIPWVGALALLLVGGCAPAQDEGPVEEVVETAEEAAAGMGATPEVVARAVLRDPDGREVGSVSFTAQETGVLVQAEVRGVRPPGPHGLHIHEVGECSAPDFTSAGGHFDPAGMPHGCPPDVQRHAGDLGNIGVGADGSGSLELISDLFTVEGGDELGIVGRAVILHEDEDDCTTQPTCAAGARQACGVIALWGLGEEGDLEPGEPGGS